MKQPSTRRNLDVAIEKAFGSGKSFIQTRLLIANTIVGQMFSAGVVKGGSSLKFRWGDKGTRFTNDSQVPSPIAKPKSVKSLELAGCY